MALCTPAMDLSHTQLLRCHRPESTGVMMMMTHAGQCIESIDAPRTGRTRVRHLSKRAPVGVPLCCKDTARSRCGNERR
jgi:hypothetical protein